MNFEHFTEQEIPYDRLENYGLTQQMIDDLPEVVMNKFLSGRRTPMLPVVIENQDGQKVGTHARIALVRLDDGSVDISFSAQWTAADLSTFSDSQQRALLAGKVIMTDVDGGGTCYGQYDDTIQQVMTVPVGIVRQNLTVIQGLYPSIISDAMLENVAKGKVVELNNSEGELASMGIDLEETIAIRFADGDARLWEQEVKANRLPKYNFGLYGCWMADDDNHLSYTPEEEYTAELQAEMRRAGQQNLAGENMRQMGR